MKTKSGNKNRNNLSNEFIHYIVDLIGPLYILHFSLSDTFVSDPKRECN